jgi:hypothetical protein
MYSNSRVSNNSLYPVCGGDYNVLVRSPENGGHIITETFGRENATKAMAKERARVKEKEGRNNK